MSTLTMVSCVGLMDGKRDSPMINFDIRQENGDNFAGNSIMPTGQQKWQQLMLREEMHKNDIINKQMMAR